jgi:NAD+ diphosphatase
LSSAPPPFSPRPEGAIVQPSSESLGFVRNPLLRRSAERDEGLAERHAADPRALTVAIAGEIPILRRNVEGLTGLIPLADLERAQVRHEQAFLGTFQDRPVFGALLDPDAAELFKSGEDHLAIDLRSIAVQGLLPPEELGIVAEAKALLFWHSRHRFCAHCGQSTALSCAGFRRDCASCGTQHFPRTDPVAIMLVHRRDRCLLGRQARFIPNSYSCLAGFIEPGETIEDAVRRETFEEAGIRVGAVRYLASQPWPFPSSLMIGCIGEALTEEIVLDRDELEDGRWFAKDEVRRMLAREHPDGLITPPPMAIANFLMRGWVEDAAG